jgi:hypothetical protein
MAVSAGTAASAAGGTRTGTATSQDGATAAVARPASLISPPQANAETPGAAISSSQLAACDAALQTMVPAPLTLDPLWINAIQPSDQDATGNESPPSEAVDAVLAEY